MYICRVKKGERKEAKNESAGHSPTLKFAVLATDTAIFTLRGGELLVRTCHVVRPPFFPDNYALPGGLIHPEENAEEAVKREVLEKAQLNPANLHIEQLATFSDIDRDPRGRVVAVAYLALVPWNKLSEEEQKDTPEAQWIRVNDARNLAYDHDEILKVALKRLQSKISYTTIIQKVLPASFTLSELEQAYTSILKKPIDKRNFRKKILKLKILKPLKEKRSGGAFRPAQLYSFSSSHIEEISML